MSDSETRPLVGRAVNDRAVWIFGGAMALAALALFATLEARRSDAVDPEAVPIVDAGGGRIASPPALAIPEPGAAGDTGAFPMLRIPPPPGSQSVRAQLGFSYPEPPRRAVPAPRYAAPPTYPADPDFGVVRPVVPLPQRPPASDDEPAPASGVARVLASRLANPATTVPQGSVIQAVMETALDSTRPGFARAIISRDVRGFDGTRVLIPRGSRLVGEYKSDLASGQNRALIGWQRLTRPDGAVIALESPAADPLGRAGVKGKVDTHFFARFGGTVLQSVLDAGVALASSRASNGTVILAAPGSTQTNVLPNPESIRPTLKVKQGTAVSVFVARDLDFTPVEP